MRTLRVLPPARDGAAALFLCVAVLFEVLTTHQDVPLRLSVPVALAMTLPLAWRRRAPMPAAAVVMAAWVVQGLAGDWAQEPQSELLPVALAFWALGAHTRDRLAMGALLGAMVGLVAHEPEDVIVLGPLMVGVFAAGRLMRSRDQLARALERDRSDAERMAVAEERARIARELHDVVAHSISVMTIQAGAERLALGDDAPRTTAALAQIEGTGRQALGEMRRMLGMLRDPDEAPDLAPVPSLSRLDDLVARMARAGLEVELTVEGSPSTVSPGLDISGYRIVQEALTNVLKHAEVSAARLRIAHAADHLEIEIVDHGRGAATSPNGAGHGLAGMRERVALYGGSLEAGPQSPSGWRVYARLPEETAQ